MSPSSLRILFVSRCLPLPLHRGDRLILRHLLAALQDAGHRTDVIAFVAGEDDPGVVEASAPLCRRLVTVPERPRSPFDYLVRLVRPFPGSARACWNRGMWGAIEACLAGSRFDVVHFFGGIQVYEFRNAVRPRPAIICPYESHSLFLERALAGEAHGGWRIRTRAALAVTRRYERVMFDGFDRVVVLAPHDAEALARLAPALPVVVIPNGVALEPLAREPDAGGRPLLLFTGNLSFAPNVAAAVVLVREVLPAVKTRHPGARVALVGANPPAAVSSLAGPDVEVTGFVEDIRPHLARASCFVAPLTQGTGMRNKVLEAMAAGVPVVSTPLGCEGIGAIDGRHALVAAGSKALADQVARLLDAPSFAAVIGAAGQSLVRSRFTWPGVADRYVQLYREVIAARTESQP
jgi:glycosyltransferase involved in cell wall biosynthesis